MPDLSHFWGTDLAIGPSGDLALAVDADLSTQRVLRRLLTTPGDDMWHLAYGAGLPRFVGEPTASSLIAALVHAQLRHETGVAQQPPPTLDVSDDGTGGITLSVQFTDPASGRAASLDARVPASA